jgi:hypothetical protein
MLLLLLHVRLQTAKQFAGDALIVLWPPPPRQSLASEDEQLHSTNNRSAQGGPTPMELMVRRAAQCAFAIQEELGNSELAINCELAISQMETVRYAALY